MKSPQIIKRSIALDGRKTSISIEAPFLASLKEIARDGDMTLSKLVALIGANRVAGSNLSSAIRVHVIERLRTRLRDLQAGSATARPAAPMSPATVPSRAF